ncbi:MAG TPA: hypothetical protein PKI19_05420 [Elusimicrobiales bacterium]|nr:hypothetical protein [Elusimicrobiales bacterium]
MRTLNTFLLTAILSGAGALCAYAAPAPLSAEELRCAAEEMQLFYYYLAADGAEVKARSSGCGGPDPDGKMPGWLQTARPAMLERKVWKDPEDGDLSEAAVWQAPASILYEFANKAQQTVPGTSTGPAVTPFAYEREYYDLLTRLILSTDRIARARLEASFEGRGAAMLSTLDLALEQLDGLTEALSGRSDEAYYKSAGTLAKLSREFFAQLFSPPAKGKVYRSAYLPKPRIMPGYRGMSLPVSGYQTLFLAAGDRVDMLVTFEAVMGGKEPRTEMVTATILQNIIVLNVTSPESMDGPGVVQLLCNPNEAQYAALSLAQGKRINITRRAPGDTQLSPMEIASFKKLLR